jgi:7-dehydrocholesterol reductase
MNRQTSYLPTWIHRTTVPLFLLICCPPAVFILWYTATSLDGSLWAFARLSMEQGFFATLFSIWGPLFFGTATAWKIIGAFACFELFLMKALPGKTYSGPITPQGNLPVYKDNGVAAFFITICAFLLGSYQFQWFSPTILYDNLGAILGALNSFSLLFCLFLYIKGIYAPSSTDASRTGNPFFDYYWGTELYPRIFGWDVKMFTNCRFGMMSWCLLLLSYMAKQEELYGLSDSMIVAVALQFIYVAKFYFWEPGYMRSLDIMHDRAGFMICWGCLVWVPSVYTLSTLYLVHYPIELGTFWASAIFLAGTFCIMINYFADRQRQQVRATNGKCAVWGSKPDLISATYTTESGETKTTVLLASGWWAISRHFHYIPEITGAFFWALPALFSHFLPYFYVVFLTILLTNRAFRHDKRCKDKYGKYWERYCEKVPYKIIPYVY